MVTSFKRSHACTAALKAPNPAAGHHQPMPPPESTGHSQASLGQSLVGSLLMSPGSWYTPASVCALQESVSQSYVRSGSSMVWLMATSSKRAYAIPKSSAPRAPGSSLLTHTSPGDSCTLIGKSRSVSCGVTALFSWVLVHTRFCLCLPRICFPVLCKVWQLYDGVNGNLLQEGLYHTQACCTQSPCPAAVHC